MDELDLSGKKYISSKRAAELTGYAKDYIGQLARAGKVSATRFGRAWYVEEASILAHAKSDTPVKAQESIIEVKKTVEAPLKASKISLPQHFYKPYSFPNTWSSVKYLDDHSELIPSLSKANSNSSEITSKNIATSATVDIVLKKNVEIKIAPIAHQKPASGARMKIIPGVNFDIPQPRQAMAHIASVKAPVKRTISIAAPLAMAGVFGLLIASYALIGLTVSNNFTSIASTGYYTASVFASLQGFLSTFAASDYIQQGVSAIMGFTHLILGSFWAYAQAGYDFVKSLF